MLVEKHWVSLQAGLPMATLFSVQFQNESFDSRDFSYEKNLVFEFWQTLVLLSDFVLVVRLS
jgi:hypothetical protein